MGRKDQLRRLDGVLLLDKPSNISSNAALQRARRAYDAAKAGHTGTLDPLASGLLPVCFGAATRLAASLLEARKSYVAELRLGIRTDSGDAEGKVISTRPVKVDRKEFEAEVARFVGEQLQTPPMYSALKRDGRPLYEYARRGETVERAPRQVRIERIAVLRVLGEEVEIAVDCSKGTYIRTLADDIGEALGCGAHLAALRRTRVGPFLLENAVSLGDIEALPAGNRDQFLLPADVLALQLPVVELDARDGLRFRHGQAVAGPGTADGLARIYAGGRFLGIGRCFGGRVSPEQVFCPA